MDFENAKENIQPLASGRNVSLLQASVISQDGGPGHELLIQQRKQMEENIESYEGDDPLTPWYDYICWIEQSYPAGGTGSGLQAAMHKCLTKFEQDERYKQDGRLIKLFIKYMKNQKDQLECYQQMYNSGIGTMLADFYIAWAYSYDLSGNMSKADDIFRLGIACRAEPLDDLREAHQHFGYTVGQRVLHTGERAEEAVQELNERRLALQSLRGQKLRNVNTITVGSIRTGAAVRSQMPGVVEVCGQSSRTRPNLVRQVSVYHDENADGNLPIAVPPLPDAEPKTSLRSIIDATRQQENLKEPVGWNKAHAKPFKPSKIFGRHAHAPELGFGIHVDEQKVLPFKFPPNWVEKNKPLEPWVTPVTIEDEPNPKELPCYNKCLCYPLPNLEFSPEEYMAYYRLKRIDPQHRFVQKHNKWWSLGMEAGVRRFPNYPSASTPQTLDELDKYFKPPESPGIQFNFAEIYNDAEQREYQVEELLANKWREKRNMTVLDDMDMEETVCLPGEKMPRRKSFFPSSSRKSIMPSKPANSIIVEEEEEEVQKLDQSKRKESAVLKEQSHMTLRDKPALDQTPLTIPSKSCLALAPSPVQAPLVASAPSPIQVPLPAPVSIPGPAPAAAPAITPSLALKPVNDKDNFVMPAPPSRPKIEIFVDPEEPTPPSAADKPASCAYFDADETCSTQMFNIFIKNQAVSTPKAPQKQAPTRQFGTLLKPQDLEPPASVPDDHPPPPPATNASPGETVSPVMRKQLSTILETSEHGTQSSAATIGTTKSTITSASSSSSPSSECTPGPLRYPRMPNIGLSMVGEEPEQQSLLQAGNFTRRELWEPNAPSGPLMKSIRFQEDKTETVPRPHQLFRFQEDKTETLPKMPLAEVANSSKVLNVPPEPPMLPAESDKGDNFFNLFCKSPDANKTFGSPLRQDVSKKRCDQPTPDVFKKSQKVLPLPQEVSKLAESFMADLSFVPETQPQPKPNNFEIFLDETVPETQPQLSPLKQNHSIKKEEIRSTHLTDSFMKNCTELSSCPPASMPMPAVLPSSANSSSATSLKFLSGLEKSPTGKCENFELNAATEMFATNISMIKNSTLLPVPQINPPLPLPIEEHGDLSIYYKKTPLTPKQTQRSWSQPDQDEDGDYLHPVKGPLEQSVLNETLADTNVNPFNADLIASLLESIDFTLYIEKLPNCQMLRDVKKLQPNTEIYVNDEQFKVLKCIGKGAYGSVFSGKHVKSGKKVALKQERPTNYWEYYVGLEVHSRLTSEQMIPAFMAIDYALVGNNSSIYISDFSPFGSLIDVCNKIKKHTNRNVDEYVVMHLSCQILDIIDHLHAIGIIHADIKPDNFLLMQPLKAQPNDLSLQLIDFGVAIDTKLFPPNQSFNYINNDDIFKCIEMRTGRPWTYQLDLFGLAGVLHVMLLGRYMEVAQRTPNTNIWLPKNALPRYYNQIWESIFRTLLNIRDCRTMPNLQQLKTSLKSEMAEKEKYVNEAVHKFNAILLQS
ncbi:uncharacterized protein Dwil_GK21755 [Drosophila willistoni]|nr:uncharacterized protein Dwil_GK21755 [Drosophila willistoni]